MRDVLCRSEIDQDLFIKKVSFQDNILYDFQRILLHAAKYYDGEVGVAAATVILIDKEPETYLVRRGSS